MEMEKKSMPYSIVLVALVAERLAVLGVVSTGLPVGPE